MHSSKTKQRGSRSFVASETWVFPGLDPSLEAELAMAGAVVGAAFGSASVPRQEPALPFRLPIPGPWGASGLVPEQSRTSGPDGAKRTGEEARETGGGGDRASNEVVWGAGGEAGAVWTEQGVFQPRGGFGRGKELTDSGWLWARDLCALSASQLCE